MFTTNVHNTISPPIQPTTTFRKEKKETTKIRKGTNKGTAVGKTHVGKTHHAFFLFNF
jgi:hypothetical protein